MHKWAKRGIQTALVTGGIFMLGTGIASADENVDPDRPASPIDGGVTVPVQITNNNLGAPDGQHAGPEVNETISTHAVTDPVVAAYEQNAPADDPFRGNRVNADLVVPVQMTNNAVGVLGDANTSGGDTTQTYDGSSDISTDGTGDALAGNVVDLDWAAPVQIANNAGALGGDATTSGNDAQQTTTTGGDVTTNGSGGTLAGNILAGQAATPLQGNNNAFAVGGVSASGGNEAESSAQSGGFLETDGSDGVLSGNAGGGPLGASGGLNNSAGSWVGSANTVDAENSVSATGGGTQPAVRDDHTYIQTDGDNGLGSGNILEPQGAGNMTGHGIAGTWIGTASTGSDAKSEASTSNETTTDAGGFSATSGQDSVLSGNFADASAAAPIEVFCSAGSWGGIASATDCESTTNADSGGGTYTDGTGSVGGGNSVNAPLAAPLEAFGVGGSWIGTGEAEASETKTVDAGGYNGTLGNDATVGGNIVQTPVAAPGEVFGVGGAWGGIGSGTASETKTVEAGGTGNTLDDNGTGSSNVIATPVAQPVQAFGIGGAWIGEGHGDASADTTATAGGDYAGHGNGGTLSGNVGQLAWTAPAQAFGIGGVWGGNASGSAENTTTTSAGGYAEAEGSQGVGSGNIVNGALSEPLQGHGMGASWIGSGNGTSYNVTESTAGGESISNGTDSSLGGNVLYAPVGGAGSAFGNAATFIGSASGEGANEIVSNAGGDVETSGDAGSGSGNAVGAQALPIAQAFGNGASAVGVADGVGTNTTDAVSGGDITASGKGGSLSGNLFDVPAAGAGQAFGNAGTVGGIAHGIGDNTTTGMVGGTSSTSGQQNSLSGTNSELPIGGAVQVYNFSAPVLGEALAIGSNVTNLNTATQEPQINMPLEGSELSVDSVPALNKMAAAPASPLRSERSGLPADVSPMTQPMPIAAPAMPGMAAPLPAPGLPVSTLPATDDLPVLDDLSLEGLSELPAAGELPTPSLGRELPVSGELPVSTDSLPTDALPTGGLPVSTDSLPELPGVDSLPTPGLGRDLPTGGLPVSTDSLPLGTDSLPTSALPTGGLPVSTDSLPTDALPTGGLPTPGLGRDLPAAGQLPVSTDSLSELPFSGTLPAAGELPVSSDLTGLNLAMPQAPVASELPAVDSVAGRSDVTQGAVQSAFTKVFYALGKAMKIKA